MSKETTEGMYRSLAYPEIQLPEKVFVERFLGFPVIVSEKVPHGEVWLVSPLNGEMIIGKIKNIDTEKMTYELVTMRPVEHVTITLPPDKEEKAP